MGFEKMLNEKRERERKGRKRGGVVSRIRWMGARGKAKKKKKTRELEQKQRAEGEALGSRSRRRERRSSCSLEQTRLPPRKGRKTRSGPRRGRNSLSLSLSARSLSSFSSSLPAISLSCSSLDGALRCAQETRQRRRNARPAHRVHTCTTYYTSVRP